MHNQSTFICRASFNEIEYEMKKSISYSDINANYIFSPEKIIKLFNGFLRSYNQFVKFYFK